MEVMTAVVNERLVRYLAKEASTQTLPLSDVDRLSFDEDEWEIYECVGDEGRDERIPSVLPARLRVVPELETNKNPTYRMRNVHSQTEPVQDGELGLGSSLLNPRVAAVHAAVQGLTEPVEEESHLQIDFATFDKYILQSSEPFPEDTFQTARRIFENQEFLQRYARCVKANATTPADSSDSGTTAAIVSVIQFILEQSNLSLGTPCLPDHPKLVFSTQRQPDQDEECTPSSENEEHLPAIECMPVLPAGDAVSEPHCSDALFLCTFIRQYRTKPRGTHGKRKRLTPVFEADPDSAPEESVQTKKRTRRSATTVGPSRPTTRALSKLQAQAATSSRNARSGDKKGLQTRGGARGNKRTATSGAISTPPLRSARGIGNEGRESTSRSGNRADALEQLNSPIASSSVVPAGSPTTNQAPNPISSSSHPSDLIIRAGARPPPALMRSVADIFAAPGCRRHVLVLSFEQLHASLWYFDRAGSINSSKIPILDLHFIATILRLGFPDRRQLGFEPQIMPLVRGVMGPALDISGYRTTVQGREFALDKAVQLEGCSPVKTVYLAHGAAREEPRRDSAEPASVDVVFVEFQWPLADSPRADELVRLAAAKNGDESRSHLCASTVAVRLSDGVRGCIFPGGADRLYLDRELRIQVFGPLPTSDAEFNDLDGLRETYVSIVKSS